MSDLLVIDLSKFVKSLKHSRGETLAERVNEFALNHIMYQFDVSATFGERPQLATFVYDTISDHIAEYLNLTDEAKDEVVTFLRSLYNMTHDGFGICIDILEHWEDSGLTLVESKKVNRHNFIEKMTKANNFRTMVNLKMGYEDQSISDIFDNFNYEAFDGIIAAAMDVELDMLRQSGLSKKKLTKLVAYLQEDNRSDYLAKLEKYGLNTKAFMVFMGMIMPNVNILNKKVMRERDPDGVANVESLLPTRKDRKDKKFAPDSALTKLMNLPHSGPSTRMDLDTLDRDYLKNNIHYMEPKSAEIYANELVNKLLTGEIDFEKAQECFAEFIKINIPNLVNKVALVNTDNTLSIGFKGVNSPAEARAANHAARKLLRLN